MIDSYVNAVLAFNRYNRQCFALCYAVGKDNKILCYRVRKTSTPGKKNLYYINDKNGQFTGYVVEYACRFQIPAHWIKQKLLRCDPAVAAEAHRLYATVPPLPELEAEYKELREKYKRAKEKSTLRRMNEVNELINARKLHFLTARPQAPTGRKDAYSNYKTLPNRDGISTIFRGGGCSSK